MNSELQKTVNRQKKFLVNTLKKKNGNSIKLLKAVGPYSDALGADAVLKRLD